MEDTIILGRGQQMIEMPQTAWQGYLTQVPQHGRSRLSFMTDAHHQVRNFVVSELVDTQAPVEPEFISRELNIPLSQVIAILEELEQRLFFLVRNEQNAVSWAYPLTIQATPHRLTFSTGEQLYGA